MADARTKAPGVEDLLDLDPAARERLARFRERLLAKIDVPFAGDVLDIGCMDGRVASGMAQTARSVTGLDIAPSPVWEHLTRDNLHFVAADAQQLPFEDASFDLVVAGSMLHHAASPTRIIREMVRVRRPGGTLVIIEPNRRNPMTWVHLTLMSDHDHFETKAFVRLVERIVPIRRFHQFELHLWPTDDPALRATLERLEDGLERSPLWKPFVLFNVAIA
jgi:ubiquinone/menaquinone biosynthesis C-methylase UbiE